MTKWPVIVVLAAACRLALADEPHEELCGPEYCQLRQLHGAHGRRLSVAASTVVLVPGLTSGPFPATLADYVDSPDMLTRAKAGSPGLLSDRVSVLAGLPMNLTINLYTVSGNVGTELTGARVYIWHADTLGVYSAYAGMQAEDTRGQQWLRAVQTSNANGQVQFRSIVPGWYMGRAVHYHVRVHLPSSGASASNDTYVVTSQFFFTDTFVTSLKSQSPYSSLTTAQTFLAGDNIYTSISDRQVAAALVLNVAGTAQNGYGATFNLGIAADASNTAASGTIVGAVPGGPVVMALVLVFMPRLAAALMHCVA